ncbi:MAG TPA: phosphoribosyltransferase family protein [Coriobacteriia bacterium]
MWRDRIEAGRELAAELARRGYAGRADVIVLGVPRGGVEVAREVADGLGAPLDVVVVRKIGAPGWAEFAAGAVDLDGAVHANPEAGVSRSWLEQAAVAEHAEALRRSDAYRKGRGPLELAGRTAIVVDDGIATGLTAVAALRWLSGRGAARTVIAAPVMAPDSARRLMAEADEVVALTAPAGFAAVGEFYGRFPQLSDDDVTRLLAIG